MLSKYACVYKVKFSSTALLFLSIFFISCNKKYPYNNDSALIEACNYSILVSSDYSLWTPKAYAYFSYHQDRYEIYAEPFYTNDVSNNAEDIILLGCWKSIHLHNPNIYEFYGDAESRTRTDAVPFAPADIVNAHTEVVSPSPSVTQTSPVFTAVDSTRRTEARSLAEHSPALSAADKEKLRMARINANYKHDKKLLAKEDPAFVRSPFHNIGHAQGNEQLSERDLYKIARELNEEKKEKLRNGR